MIVDFHTHIFPPEVRERREAYIRRDPTFAEMYGDPKAKIATGEELLESMQRSGVDVSVALGFAWQDHETCVRHNDYLLESAANSSGRIVPFCTVNMADDGAGREIERVAAGGAHGLGELRPESQGWALNGQAGELLAALAARPGLILLFHVTEPAGHKYRGKEGLRLDSFCRFAVCHSELRIVGAHLGGGLPFFAAMPEAGALHSPVYVDTAAQPLLYEGSVYQKILSLAGPEPVLFGSDFPLIAQSRQIEEIRSAIQDENALGMVLGGNAARLLGLDSAG